MPQSNLTILAVLIGLIASMAGVVMTNQYFTSPAVEAAKKLRILLWDSGYMDAMMEEQGLTL